MSYSKKTWTNRTSEYPNRYRMTSINGNVADVAIIPKEGTITNEGDRFDADTMNDLETRIDNEFSSVENSISTQDVTLRRLITAEQTRATGIENLLRTDVDKNTSGLASEISRATAKENAIAEDLADEITRATVVESELRTNVTSLQGRMTDTESDVDTLASRIASLEQSVEIETDRAEDVEATLDTKIDGVASNLDAEVTRATSAENTISTNLANEVARATSVEANITTSISNEIARATQAENDLHDYVDEKISMTYRPSGSVYFADLPALTKNRIGNVYNIKDGFTTTSDFVEGAGHSYPVGTNVGIQQIEEVNYTEVGPTGEESPSNEGWYELVDDAYVLSEDTEVDESKTYYLINNYKLYYDVMAGFIDASHFVTDTDYATFSKAGVMKPDGTSVIVDENGVLSSLGGGQGSAGAVERMIAPIEHDASTSTRTYVEGQRLILNETLYKAKTAIDIGDELVIDTNIELANKLTDFDTTPTNGSTKFVTSGGVYSYIDNMITQAIAASY